MKQDDIVYLGAKVNYLTLTGTTQHGKNNEWYWTCKCQCGNDKIVLARSCDLRKGLVKSCGCYNKEHRNIEGLGVGWLATCEICGKTFTAKSNKSTVCSHDCRFLLYQNKGNDSDCWEWTGPTNSDQGYGVLFLNTNKENGRRMVTSAHRYAYEKYNGVLEDNMCIMHTCDNPKCTNPNHLVQGTWADNNKDRSMKSRSGSRIYTEEQKRQYSERHRGEGGNMAKITTEQAIKIKYNHPELTGREVGNLYGLTKSAVNSIRRGASWSHV